MMMAWTSWRYSHSRALYSVADPWVYAGVVLAAAPVVTGRDLILVEGRLAKRVSGILYLWV